MYDGMRYYPLDNKQRRLLLQALVMAAEDASTELAQQIQSLVVIFEDLPAKEDADWIEAAKEIWEGSNSDHDVEIQDNAVVSESESGGAWVQGWLWVANEQNPALPGIPDEEDDDA